MKKLLIVIVWWLVLTIPLAIIMVTTVSAESMNIVALILALFFAVISFFI